MILFIDDEKNTISGYLDYFSCLVHDGNSCYDSKHFFFPTKALEYLSKNYSNINLIVLDLMLFYGELEKTKSKSGGLRCLNSIRDRELYNQIPILLYTIVEKDEIGIDLEEFENVYYLDRNCRDEVFFDKVNQLLKIVKV